MKVSDSIGTFDATTRATSEDSSSFDRPPLRPAGSLSHLSRVLPDAGDIHMEWECTPANVQFELSHLLIGQFVASMTWQGLRSLNDTSLTALAEIVIKNPSLQKLTHDVEDWDLRPADLHVT